MRHTTAFTALSAFLVCIVAGTLSGCYMPAPVSHARLNISENSTLMLNGQAVMQQDLAAQVAKIKASQPDLVVKIEVAPNADMATVRLVVDTVKQAQLRLAFAKDGAGQ